MAPLGLLKPAVSPVSTVLLRACSETFLLRSFRAVCYESVNYAPQPARNGARSAKVGAPKGLVPYLFPLYAHVPASRFALIALPDTT
jgi:hypothetical protein